MGLLDRNKTEIVTGTKVTLKSANAKNTAFHTSSQAVVIGTSHHGKRVWLGHIENKDVRTDREPKNIIAPIPLQE